MSAPCLAPTAAQAVGLMSRGIKGPVIMLNLLRFREVADYSATPDLAPDAPVSGAVAFDLYIAATRPLLERSSGTVLFSGRGGQFFIGPEAERWDRVLLIKQASVSTFLDWATNEEFLASVGHRTAALLDSRLLPVASERVV